MEENLKNVKIIAITKPVIMDEDDDLEIQDANDLIVYCARVSNPSNQKNFDTGDKLLAYCVRNKHWSIFEMVNIVIEINTTRDIGRQILRHKSCSFQEFSGRYADPTELGYVVREARLQDVKNRQNSIELQNSSLNLVEQSELNQEWEDMQLSVYDHAIEAYQWAINRGIAKEQARAVLPEGMTKSRMYVQGTLRSWIHWSLLRKGPETQKEHRLLAQEVFEQLSKIFPFMNELENV